MQRIEGVPVGTKIVKIELDRPPVGSLVMNPAYVQIVPDNIYNVIDLNSLPIPDGIEIDGSCIEFAFRALFETSTRAIWLGVDGKVHGYMHDHDNQSQGECLRVVLMQKDTCRIILRKKKVVKRYLVMDRILITEPCCVVPPNSVPTKFAELVTSGKFAAVDGSILKMRIEEVEE